MAKQGMARPDRTHTKPKNDVPPVPEIQGKAKHGKKHARPIISGAGETEMKVYHELKGDGSVGDPNPSQPGKSVPERPIPEVYSVIDSDLARDNLENDIPAADLEEL